jgi:polyisoprenoid-binding protein YceI
VREHSPRTSHSHTPCRTRFRGDPTLGRARLHIRRFIGLERWHSFNAIEFSSTVVVDRGVHVWNLHLVRSLRNGTSMNTRWWLLTIALLVTLLAASVLFARQFSHWRMESAAHSENVRERCESLEDDVLGLRNDLQMLTTALETQSVAIDGAFGRIDRSFGERLDALRTELATRPIREAAVVDTPAIAVSALEADPPVEPVAVTAPAAKNERHFLAFRLSSTGFAFDARRRFVIASGLSRVGFDAKSTLHDFTGVASDVRGELTTCLARPEDGCRGTIIVSGAGLTTGESDRDANMYDDLRVADHPELTFAVESFRPTRVDEAESVVEGSVLGQLGIRGVTHSLEMPVRVSVDASKRVLVEGETVVHLPDYGVPVPNKLGVIRMDPDVRVWISLRLRAVGGTEEGSRDAH